MNESESRAPHVSEGAVGSASPVGPLEEAAATAVAKLQDRPGRDADTRAQRHTFLITLSVIVVVLVVGVSVGYGEEIFGAGDDPSWIVFIIPYLTCLAGVALFILNTARKKGDEWSLKKYLGDHVFRVAQAFAYLFIVWWAIAAVGSGEEPLTAAVGTNLPPNIVGFLVGFFILRVERAMDGLGDKFEEVLTAVLPRAMSYVSAEERRRQQLRAAYRIDDVVTQWEALRPHLGDEGAKARVDEVLRVARKAIEGEDPERAQAAVTEVLRLFEEVKSGLGEVLVPVEDFLQRAIERPD